MSDGWIYKAQNPECVGGVTREPAYGYGY